MPRISATQDATKITINGHGIRVDARHEIAPGVFVTPASMDINGEELEARTASHLEYAAILFMGGQVNFAIEVNDPRGGEVLAAKGWNALWLFGLLSLACRLPCISMFAFSNGKDAPYSLVARSPLIIPLGSMRVLWDEEANWLRRYFSNYDSLISTPRFSAALRAHTNAHYLYDLDQRLMLIWAGIEGLLAVDSELRRRVAMYSGILLDGTREEKIAQSNRARKAYDFRSKVVHGAPFDNSRLAAEHAFASGLLMGLLGKCVMLGRVPSAVELDEAAVAASIE